LSDGSSVAGQPIPHPQRARRPPRRVDQAVALRSGQPRVRRAPFGARSGEDAPEGILHRHGQPDAFVEHVGESLLRGLGRQGLAECGLEAVLAGQGGLDIGPGLPVAEDGRIGGDPIAADRIVHLALCVLHLYTGPH
jgi:hypothetical protein